MEKGTLVEYLKSNFLIEKNSEAIFIEEKFSEKNREVLLMISLTKSKLKKEGKKSRFEPVLETIIEIHHN